MDSDAAHPSTSLALVPRPATRDPHPRTVTPGGPSASHRFFYGMGYAALPLLLLAAWLEPMAFDVMAVLAGLAIVMLGIAGLGVIIHVLYHPNERKVRMGLGAVASLALTVLALAPVSRAAREVHAQSAIVRLQPLADELLRNGRIRQIAFPAHDWIELNGFSGRMDTGDPSSSGPAVPLAAVLQRDGISRLELVRMRRRMEQAGVSRLEVEAGYVGFRDPGIDASLLYVRPGHAPPSPERQLMERMNWTSQPLGGGWYMIEGRYMEH